MAAHAESCRAVGVSFVPLVVETLGGWSKGAADALTSIGRLLGQRLGIPPLNQPPTSFRDVQSHSGEAMQPFGSAVFLFDHPW